MRCLVCNCDSWHVLLQQEDLLFFSCRELAVAQVRCLGCNRDSWHALLQGNLDFLSIVDVYIPLLLCVTKVLQKAHGLAMHQPQDIEEGIRHHPYTGSNGNGHTLSPPSECMVPNLPGRSLPGTSADPSAPWRPSWPSSPLQAAYACSRWSSCLSSAAWSVSLDRDQGIKIATDL